MVAGVHPETMATFGFQDVLLLKLNSRSSTFSPGILGQAMCKERELYIRKRPEEDLIFDSGRVQDYLSKYLVPANKFKDYESWITIGMALHYLSKEGRIKRNKR